jgi:hypothetical protein
MWTAQPETRHMCPLTIHGTVGNRVPAKNVGYFIICQSLYTALVVLSLATSVFVLRIWLIRTREPHWTNGWGLGGYFRNPGWRNVILILLDKVCVNSGTFLRHGGGIIDGWIYLEISASTCKDNQMPCTGQNFCHQ